MMSIGLQMLSQVGQWICSTYRILLIACGSYLERKRHTSFHRLVSSVNVTLFEVSLLLLILRELKTERKLYMILEAYLSLITFNSIKSFLLSLKNRMP